LIKKHFFTHLHYSRNSLNPPALHCDPHLQRLLSRKRPEAQALDKNNNRFG